MKIFLLGMMGSGKSFWMKKLSSLLNIPGYDLDELVEAAESSSINKMFAEKGEEYFRKMETLVLRGFDIKDEFVLATGGGTPCFHENMKWMNEQGITILVDEPIEVLVSRLVKEQDHRPLIAGLSEQALQSFLQQKWMERREHYEKARFTITDDSSVEGIISKIKEENA